MGIKVANNAFGTLAASITNSDTSITLTTGQGARFPSLGAGDYFYATLIDTSNNLEIVKCTARSTDVLTVVRAQEGTSARAYSTGDRIEIRITAQTFIDATSLPDQTGNAGKYLTTDGTNISWGAIAAPTPAAVSDQANTSTGYFDLPAGSQAQRPASPATGMIRFNTTNDTLEAFHNLGFGDDKFYGIGGRVLIARSTRTDAWNTMDVTWGLSGPKYIGYEVEVLLADANTNLSRVYMQVYDASSTLLSGAVYGYTQTWAAANDGADGADTNYNSATPAYGTQIPLTNWNTVNTSYWSQANGESHQVAKVKFFGSLPSGFTSNRWNFTGEFCHDTSGLGVTGGTFRGQINASATATATNGAVYYPITGIRIGYLDGYTNRAGAGSPAGITAAVLVYGITGLEERDFV